MNFFMKKLVGLFALVIFIGVMITIEIDMASEEVFDFPIIGKISALIDLRDSQVNWYVYGLIDKKTLEMRQQQLKPFGIVLIESGCTVGGPTYKRDQAYNRTIYEGLPIAAQRALNTY